MSALKRASLRKAPRSASPHPAGPALATARPDRDERLVLASLLTVVLGVLAANGWPYLKLALVPAGLWLLTFLGFLWKRPEVVQKRATLWLGSAVLVVGAAGVLALYREGWGGSLGTMVAGPAPSRAELRVGLIMLLGLTLLDPQRSWEMARVVGKVVASTLRFVATCVVLIGQYAARVLAISGRAIARITWNLILVIVRSYREHPLHRHVLRMAAAGLRAFARPWRALGQQMSSRLPAPLQTLPPPFGRSPQPDTAASTATAEAEQATPSEEGAPEDAEALEEEEEAPKQGARRPMRASGKAAGGWALPALELLKVGGKAWVSQEENAEKARLIEQTLAEYGVEVTVEEIRPGPVVTQFGLVPGWVRRYREVLQRDERGQQVRDEMGRPVKQRVEEKTRVKVDNVLSREKDLAMALAATSIRFEAPVPGEPFVGLEVPNAQPAVVSLRSVVESDAFRTLQRKGLLPIVLGKGSGGESVVADLAEMPHLLIAGATGSGKSVCMNVIIASLLMQFSPLELRLFLVDPKRVELACFADLPHLLAPVLVEVEKAVPALRGLIGEMTARYKRFETARVRNIQAYNRTMETPESRLPYIVLVIDELADLMMTGPAEVEQALCRLAQLGRATGIHLVVATQRPSVDVVTGLIKANFPSRLSFAVSSQVDSRTIIDGVGAEKLLGRGDMLFLPTNFIKPKRLQGAYISDGELRRLVAHWKEQRRQPLPAVSLHQEPEGSTQSQDGSGEAEGDVLLQQAKALAVSYRRVSAPLFQRKLGIGYTRAEGLLERLEVMGIVEPGDPGKSRAVIPGGG